MILQTRAFWGLLIAAVVATSCALPSAQNAALPGKDLVTPPAPIKIGVAGPMTGVIANFGMQMTKGAAAAVADINSTGGINGRKLELVVEDDLCNPKQAPIVANNLVAAQVAAVVGHFCSSSTIPASIIYAENNILQITPSSTSALVTERNLPTILRTCGRDDQQGDAAADFIAGLKPQHVAIIHDQSFYGRGVADATRNRLSTKHNVRDTLYETIRQGEKDFGPLIAKMKGARIDLIVFGGYVREASLLVRQAHDQGLNALFVAGDALATSEFPDQVGKNQATARVAMTFITDSRRIPAAKDVVERLRASGYDPEGYTLHTYAAIQAVAATLRGNNLSRDGKVLAQWLKKNPVQTVLGTKSWDEKGDLTTPEYVVYGWREINGRMFYAELNLKQ